MEDGGNAVDAAIATAFCVGAINPQSSGIGGGFFMTLYDPVNQTAQCLDAREVAPIAATKNMFRGKPLDSQKGPIHFFTIELNPRVEKNSSGCSLYVYGRWFGRGSSW